tara:strand:- start:1235 stop:1720 length:486 start_codon:yes stop_codon:yes gene_type:complete
MATIKANKENKEVALQAISLVQEYFDVDLSEHTITIKKTWHKADLESKAAANVYGKQINARSIGSNGHFVKSNLLESSELLETLVHELVHVYQHQSNCFEGFDNDCEYTWKATEIHARNAAGYIVNKINEDVSEELFNRCFRPEMLTAEYSKTKSLEYRAA